MTASLAIASVATRPFSSTEPLPTITTPPVTIPIPERDARLSAQAADYDALVDSGVHVVDIREQSARGMDGVLSGAIALDSREVLDRLTPGTVESLRSARYDASWLLISDDGHDAEWLAWHLQARGVAGTIFLVGGYRALRRAGVTGRISPRELADISAH